MEERFADDRGIEDLTRVVGVSASHLMPTFRRWVHTATMLNNPLFLTLALVAILLAYGIYVIVY